MANDYIVKPIIYVVYNGHINIDADTLIVSAWNEYSDKKIFFNDKDFFAENFENSYDAAYAVSLSGAWRWSDHFVYFDEEGYLTSFSHWDDKNSPIEIDKIDISNLINNLKK